MLTVLTESKLNTAKGIFSSILNEDGRISQTWLKKPGMDVALIDSGLDLHYGLTENVQRFQNALCNLECTELLAAPYAMLMGVNVRYGGGKIFGSAPLEFTSPVVIEVQNHLEAIQFAFSDVLLSENVVVTDAKTSFILLDDLAGEYGVIAGEQSFVESCRGLSIEEARADWNNDIASYNFIVGSRGMKYVTDLTNHYFQG